jgi:MFS transporter, OFA family, oxalate/formate antiporter
VFEFAACIAMMAGVCAKVVLQPMRRKWIFQSAPAEVHPEPAFSAAPLGSGE